MKLPPQWKLRSLGEFISELEAGVSVNSDDFPPADGEPGVLKVSAVSGGKFFPMESKRVLPAERGRLAVTPRRGNIIISRSNTAQLVAENAFIEKDFPTLFLSDKLWQTVYQPEAEFEPLWLSQVLQSPRVRQQLVRLATGTSRSMKNITKSTFLDLEVPVPPPLEQQKIAAILGAWDKVIERLQTMAAAKTERLLALRQQLLTGSRRFSRFRKERWSQLTLADIVTYQPRLTTKPKGAFLAAGIRSHGKGVFLKHDFEAEDIALDELWELRTDDLVVNITFGWEGAVAIVPPEANGALVSHRFPTFVFKPGVSFPGYFRHVIRQQTFIFEMGLASPGGAGRNRVLSKKNFLRIPIKLPPLEEQKRIAAVLNACAQEIRLLEAELEALKRQKRGLMQKLLTGDIRVKT